MTIFGSGYRSLEYRPTSIPRRLWALTWLEVRGPFRSRWGTLLFLTCQIPLIRSLFVLTIWAGFWEFGGGGLSRGIASGRWPAEFDPARTGFYLAPALGDAAFVFVLLLTTLVSARAVAKDRASHGLEILWTRGIGPVGYFVAKWLGSVLLVGLGAIAGPLLLWGLAQASAPDDLVFFATLAVLPRIALALGFFVVVLTGLATALSALARSPNLASILWVVVMVGTAAVGRVFAQLFRGETWLRALSPWDATKRVAEAIAGVTPRIDFAPSVAVVAVAAWVAALAVLAARRLRTAEAVG